MRSEKQMLDLIRQVAAEDERIRAAILTGSRVDPNAKRDIFQDFDVLYLVTEVQSFRQDSRWIDRFGERIILQMPEAMRCPPPEDDGRFSYLMLLVDGNRIDLTLLPVAKLELVPRSSLSLVLLDKDQISRSLPQPTDRDYLPTPPDAKAFADSCNEFWWVSAYVAKGLWRREIVYAKRMLDQVLREELMRMLTWYVGIKTNFSRNLVSYGRHVDRELEPELWSLLQKTYSGSNYEDTWESLFAMCALFRSLATSIAENYEFEYPWREDERVTAHLKRVRALPRDAAAYGDLGGTGGRS